MSLSSLQSFSGGEMFIGNEHTRIIHSPYCEWAHKIGYDGFVKFETLYDALSMDYHECKSCFGEQAIEKYNAAEDKLNKIKKYEEIKKEIEEREFNECISCHEIRGVQKAHILPKKVDPGNLIPLCPNCHWYYDHNLLNQSESQNIINWLTKKKIESIVSGGIKNDRTENN